MTSLDSPREISWPIELADILHKSFSDLPRLAAAGMPLCDCAIDHFAVAVTSPRELKSYWQSLTEGGAETIEPVLLWPDDVPGCQPVSNESKKWMVTLDCYRFKLVLLAPHNESDLIARFLKHTGTGVHHLAFTTSNIRAKLEECLNVSGVSQISPLAIDSNSLSQVFVRIMGDARIIELIERKDTFHGTFTCRNIAALTKGEVNESISQKI